MGRGPENIRFDIQVSPHRDVCPPVTKEMVIQANLRWYKPIETAQNQLELSPIHRDNLNAFVNEYI